MRAYHGYPFQGLMYTLAHDLMLASKPVDSRTWQSQSTADRPGMSRTWEIEDAVLEIAVPSRIESQATIVKPNLPWADLHFEERVGGNPVNPPPSHKVWPFAQAGNDEHLKDQKFSHTYPERFWPTHAGHAEDLCGIGRDGTSMCDFGPTVGVRYEYGDLLDVVSLLVRDPTTRQAYLPVWFPEDTGAVRGQRVPCTLGYQFRIRNGRLNCTYGMRSCDYLRHLRDDIYLAMRLMYWVGENFWALADQEMPSLQLGTLTLNIGSLHIFDGDMAQMPLAVEKLRAELSVAWLEAMRS